MFHVKLSLTITIFIQMYSICKWKYDKEEFTYISICTLCYNKSESPIAVLTSSCKHCSLLDTWGRYTTSLAAL